MSYAPDAVRAKLSALNETQESIVSVAQWVMFHRSVYFLDYCLYSTYNRVRRRADETVQLWFQRLKDSGANKRLNLIYLANGNKY